MNRFALASLSLSAFALLAVPAAMADAKVYSPAGCKITGGALTLTGNGSVQNISQTLAGSVLCPIVRDNTAAKPTSVVVGVVDNSSLVIGDGDIKCRLVGSTASGKTVFSGTESKTVGTNSSGQILPIILPATIPTDAQIAVSCIIPRRGVGDPASVFGSIKVVEPDPGN